MVKNNKGGNKCKKVKIVLQLAQKLPKQKMGNIMVLFRKL